MERITAALLIIGNEILSGRTQDLNIQYIAKNLSEAGIYLEEVRIVPDLEASIIDSVAQLHKKYTYLFTTGGIGPTHDDITSSSIAKAFDIELIKHPEALNRITDYYKKSNRTLNDASIKMAYIPEGAELIDNSATAAPGFMVKNVYVMAGVPYIMQAMMEWLLPKLRSSTPIESKTITIAIGESLIAKEMEEIEKVYPDVSVGSYPLITGSGHPATSVVLRSSNSKMLQEAFESFKNSISSHQIIP